MPSSKNKKKVLVSIDALVRVPPPWNKVGVQDNHVHHPNTHHPFVKTHVPAGPHVQHHSSSHQPQHQVSSNSIPSHQHVHVNHRPHASGFVQNAHFPIHPNVPSHPPKTSTAAVNLPPARYTAPLPHTDTVSLPPARYTAPLPSNDDGWVTVGSPASKHNKKAKVQGHSAHAVVHDSEQLSEQAQLVPKNQNPYHHLYQHHHLNKQPEHQHKQQQQHQHLHQNHNPHQNKHPHPKHQPIATHAAPVHAHAPHHPNAKAHQHQHKHKPLQQQQQQYQQLQQNNPQQQHKPQHIGKIPQPPQHQHQHQHQLQSQPQHQPPKTKTQKQKDKKAKKKQQQQQQLQKKQQQQPKSYLSALLHGFDEAVDEDYNADIAESYDLQDYGRDSQIAFSAAIDAGGGGGGGGTGGPMPVEGKPVFVGTGTLAVKASAPVAVSVPVSVPMGGGTGDVAAPEGSFVNKKFTSPMIVLGNGSLVPKNIKPEDEVVTEFRYLAPSLIPALARVNNSNSNGSGYKSKKNKTCRDIAEECQVLVHFPRITTDSARIAIRGTKKNLKNFFLRMDTEYFPRRQKSWDHHPLHVFGLGIKPSDYAKIIGRGGSQIAELEKLSGCVLNIPNRDARRYQARSHREVIEQEIVTATTTSDTLPDFLHMALEAMLGYTVHVTPGVYFLDDMYDYTVLGYSARNLIADTAFFPDEAAYTGDVDPDGNLNIRTMGAYRKFQHYLLSAHETVDIAVYTLSDERIKDLLLRLTFRGVCVRVYTDKSTTNSIVQDLADWGVQVKYMLPMNPNRNELMHHKFAVVDGDLLLTGSMNFSWSASNGHRENISFLNLPQMVKPYIQEFEDMWMQGSVVLGSCEKAGLQGKNKKK